MKRIATMPYNHKDTEFQMYDILEKRKILFWTYWVKVETKLFVSYSHTKHVLENFNLYKKIP